MGADFHGTIPASDIAMAVPAPASSIGKSDPRVRNAAVSCKFAKLALKFFAASQRHASIRQMAIAAGARSANCHGAPENHALAASGTNSEGHIPRPQIHMPAKAMAHAVHTGAGKSGLPDFCHAVAMLVARNIAVPRIANRKA